MRRQGKAQYATHYVMQPSATTRLATVKHSINASAASCRAVAGVGASPEARATASSPRRSSGSQQRTCGLGWCQLHQQRPVTASTEGDQGRVMTFRRGAIATWQRACDGGIGEVMQVRGSEVAVKNEHPEVRHLLC